MGARELKYVSIKKAATLFGRSESAVSNYARLGILVVHDKDPRDNVTRRLVLEHAKVRLKLYQYLQRPGVRMNRQQAGALLSEICGDRDQKLRRLFRKRTSSPEVIGQLERQIDAILERTGEGGAA